MKSRTDIRNPRQRDIRRVVALIYEGLSLFEYSIVAEVFGLARPEIQPWYTFRIATMDPGLLRSNTGLRVQADGGLGLLDRAGTIFVPGWRKNTERPPEVLMRKLRRAHAEGARIASICNGAGLLAEAGLLDGLRATTHWRCADQLARRYPRVRWMPEILYVDEGQVLTSAGSAAGIDLCLHLVRRDWGARVANVVARRLVIPPHRDGGQKQFISEAVPDSAEASMAPLLDSVRKQLESPHTVQSMAAAACMSPRTFARRFVDSMGMTPYQWLLRERVQRAQALLETTEESIDAVAGACGFEDPQVLRLHFRRQVGTSPSRYRQSFRR